MKTQLFTRISTLTRRVFPSGCRLKHDVATKAALVEVLLSHKYANDAEYQETLKYAAKLYHVRPITIKGWLKQYHLSFNALKNALPGTRSVAIETITGDEKINTLQEVLSVLRAEARRNIELYSEALTSTASANETKRRTKPSISFIEEVSRNKPNV